MDLWLGAVASREAHIFPTFRAAPAIRTFNCTHFVSDPVSKIQPTIRPASQPVHHHHHRGHPVITFEITSRFIDTAGRAPAPAADKLPVRYPPHP